MNHGFRLVTVVWSVVWKSLLVLALVMGPAVQAVAASAQIGVSVAPVLQSQASRIGIEAGHGNGDTGALSCDRRVTEASITIAIAQRAANILRQRGYLVDVFRGDASGTLPKGSISGYRADAFVALHTDFCAGSNSGYKIARYGGVAGTGKNGSGDTSDRVVDALWSAYGAATGLPQDRSTGHFTLGMRYYWALNPSSGINSATPGAIIEMGWLSGDLAFMTSNDGQQRMARGIADAINQLLSNSGGSVPAGYTFCANENQRCNFSGTKDVAYGANGKFNYKYGITGGIDCNNSTFGDPINGVVKACYSRYSSGGSQCTPSSSQVALFVDVNFSGQCVIKGMGDYANPSAIGLPNDSVSSVRVGSNARAVLCHDDNYGGGCETFIGDDSDLRDNDIGNDQVSSVRVQSRSGGGGSYYSFQSYNYPGYYIRHRDFLGELTQVSSTLDRQDATFKIVPGLADGNCVSFESLNYPEHYLRHQNFRMKLNAWDGTQLFKKDATFCKRSGLANSTLVSFESYNYPGYFLRHRDFHLYIEKGNSDLFRADATFRIEGPLGR